MNGGILRQFGRSISDGRGIVVFWENQIFEYLRSGSIMGPPRNFFVPLPYPSWCQRIPDDTGWSQMTLDDPRWSEMIPGVYRCHPRCSQRIPDDSPSQMHPPEWQNQTCLGYHVGVNIKIELLETTTIWLNLARWKILWLGDIKSEIVVHWNGKA